MQTCQSQINGYFGGYISKRQKVGKLEPRKCVDKMYLLRQRLGNKSEKECQRAVSGRMITDIEMNGTMRGAVEEFNLCVNLTPGDALFAECIRTFSTVTINGESWMHRLEVELGYVSSKQIDVFIPETRRPNVRGSGSQAPMMDVYGFRPLDQSPFAKLCAFEFLRFWKAEALLPPSWYQGIPRTEWTDRGQAAVQSEAYKNGKLKLRPGFHFVVVEPEDGDCYFTFPQQKQLDLFRHFWIIVRRQRPHVPVIEGVRLPSPTATVTTAGLLEACGPKITEKEPNLAFSFHVIPHLMLQAASARFHRLTPQHFSFLIMRSECQPAFVPPPGFPANLPFKKSSEVSFTYLG